MAAEEYTVDELAAVTGHTVRNIRYYTSLGLLPGPTKQGRIAVYSEGHQARLGLVTALQVHGFTLEAIGRYMEGRCQGATVEDLAIQRAMITSWTSDSPDEAQVRIGRELKGLGVSKDALNEAHEAVQRHLAALAADLGQVFRREVVDSFRRTQHTVEEAAIFEQGLPRLRELTVEAVVVAFQGAVNTAIADSLHTFDESSAQPR